MRTLSIVMPGLDPGIHGSRQAACRDAWMAGSSPAMTELGTGWGELAVGELEAVVNYWPYERIEEHANRLDDLRDRVEQLEEEREEASARARGLELEISRLRSVLSQLPVHRSGRVKTVVVARSKRDPSCYLGVINGQGEWPDEFGPVKGLAAAYQAKSKQEFSELARWFNMHKGCCKVKPSDYTLVRRSIA